MTLDPALVGLVVTAIIGAVGSVFGLLYKAVQQRLTDMTADRNFWRGLALIRADLTDEAVAEAEKAHGV